jgi:hypothetical protein
MYPREKFLFLDRANRPVNPKLDEDLFPCKELPAMFNVFVGGGSVIFLKSHTDEHGRYVYCQQ